MRLSLFTFVVTFVGHLTCCFAVSAAEIDAQKLIGMADDIRFPRNSFQVVVKVSTTAKGKASEIHEYQVLQKGRDNTIVRTVSPATEKGQVMLLKGADLWLFLPSVSQPVRLPLSQRLTGQVANGDLARANFSGDYHATLVRTENLDQRKMYVLELKAARKGVTYNRVLYWVDAATTRPARAEFYTLSNRLMKVGIYTEYKMLGGAQRPTRLILTDPLRAGEQSVLEYSALKLRELPDKFFTKEFLRKLD